VAKPATSVRQVGGIGERLLVAKTNPPATALANAPTRNATSGQGRFVYTQNLAPASPVHSTNRIGTVRSAALKQIMANPRDAVTGAIAVTIRFTPTPYRWPYRSYAVVAVNHDAHASSVRRTLPPLAGYPRSMTISSRPHPRDEIQVAVDRYHELRRRIEEGLEPNGFGALADFYTDDAVYVDASWGRLEGKEAIAHWLEHSMVGLGDWRFPVEFTAIEGNDVVVKWTQVIPGARADGSKFAQSAYSRLRYAGGGQFDYQEDTYNMVHVLEDIEASGWMPTEPMNLPPRHPDRNWSPPRL